MKPPQLLRRDVHAALDLFANNLGDCAVNSLTVRLVVIRFPLQFRVHHFKKILGTRQAANVGCQDSVRTSFHCAYLKTRKPEASFIERIDKP
jgi:hypothetical protein